MNRLSKIHFWKWFQRHNTEYLALINKPKAECRYWLNELTAHLRAYFKFLGFGIEWQANGTAVLTISVSGRAMHFKKAEDLVAKAPAIPGWTFVALENPRPLDFLLEWEMEQTGIDPSELRFAFTPDDEGESKLVVYHPLCTRENRDRFYRLANEAVYNLLGERSFGTDIGWVEVENLSAAEGTELRELKDLPACIGTSKSSVMVDRNGKLIDPNCA